MLGRKINPAAVLLIPIILIIILGSAVYVNSVKGEFLWDDFSLVRDNVYIRNWCNWAEIFKSNISAGAGGQDYSYRPLQILTYMADYAAGKLNPAGYHITNIVLHILAALCIYWLISILYKNKLLSLLTSALFVVHPLHTEVVTYISGRADSLAAVFILLAIIFYIKQSSLPPGRNRAADTAGYIFMLLSFILALLARENALVLPLLLIVYHYTFRKKFNPAFFLPLAGIAAGYIVLRTAVFKLNLPHQVYSSALGQRLPSFFAAFTDYLKLLALPFNLHMEYGNKIFALTDIKVISGGLIAAFLIGYLFTLRRRQLFSFSILWFFIALLPAANIYPVNAYMAEHWLYLPSIGFFLGLAKGLSGLYNKGKRAITAVITISLLIFYSYLTINQNRRWQDPISFYNYTLKYAPDSSRLYNNLGIAYKDSGKYPEAVNSLRQAISLAPHDAYTYNNFGIVCNIIGRKETAIALYRKAIAVDSGYADAYYNLANIFNAAGDYAAAIDLYKKAIENNPNHIDAYCNLGIAYSSNGNNKESIRMLSKAAAVKPDDADIGYNLANAYAYAGENDKAAAAYKQTIKNAPQHVEAYNNLAIIYLRQGQYELAVDCYAKAEDRGFHNPVLAESLRKYKMQNVKCKMKNVECKIKNYIWVGEGVK